MNTPLARPFLLVGCGWHGSLTDATWRAGWRQLGGFRREMELRRSGHLSFTDIAGFIAKLGLRSRYTRAQQRLLFGSIPAPAAITATRQLITAYFDYFLEHDQHALTVLNAPSRLNRYLVRSR